MTSTLSAAAWLAAADLIDPPDDAESWEAWLTDLLPAYFPSRFSAYQRDLWEWVWAIRPGVRPDPMVAIWPRGGAKSTSAEAACVALGGRSRRRYGLYVGETQEQADDHVGNIGAMLESRRVGARYPRLADRKVGKHGNPRGWRRNRLWTAAGFVVDAIGLDSAARGVKLEDQRPDFLVIDDVDNHLDSAAVTAKKVDTLTKGLIPAGAPDLAVLAIQNLVHPDSVFAQMADGRADFLARRIISGPVPAVVGLEVEEIEGHWTIMAGTPTWPEGMGLDLCQAYVDDWGITAFRAEAQHEVEPPGGGMFDHLTFAHCDEAQVPDLERTTVWVDPAVTNTDDSDSMGIQCDGIAAGVIYRLHTWEDRTSPMDALCRAIRVAIRYGSLTVGVETDQGGDTWQSVYREAVAVVRREDELGDLWRPPRFVSDKAGAGYGPKAHRASQMLADYDRPGRIVHVRGTHGVLERALRRFPKTKPFDAVDAAFWSWRDLAQPAKRRGIVAVG